MIYKSFTEVAYFLGCRQAFAKALLCFLVVICINSHSVHGETGDDDEELSVSLNVKGIGSTEIPALYRNQEIFLSVIDVFNFLKIKNSYTETLDSITGFLITEQSTFLIEKEKNKITYQGQEFQLETGDLIRTEGKLYLRGMYFGSVFGLQCSFNFRNLAVNLNTNLELPVIKEMRQELMRANVNKLNGDEKADTLIGRRYPGASFGMADWSIINTHTDRGLNNLRMSLGFGAMLAGGETNVVFNYDNKIPFTPEQQYYLWRYVNNDKKALRQVILGKVQPHFTSSVYSPAVGAQFTNEATTFRRSFGTYTLSNTTKPGWIVELYVNNVLVSYVKADASGFYTFQVPLVYGNSSIRLRFYGPYGEERALEENVNIPFNFLPSRKFEYNISAGIIEDAFHTYKSVSVFGDSLVTTTVQGQENSKFTRAKFNYGLNRFITVGGGVEYLSSVTSGPTMPFVNTSIRLAPLLLLTAEYTDKVVTRGMLTYRRPSNLQFELNYSVFDKDQTAILHSYREQRKANVSYPFRGKNFSAYSRLSVDQIILENTQYTTTELLLSGAVKGVSTNISSYALFMSEADPLVYSNVSLGIRLPRHIVFTPQMQYEYTQAQLVSYKLNLEKRVEGFGLLNVYYEENLQSNFMFVGVGFRLDLSFAQAGFLAVKSNHATTFTENANGSFIYNHRQRRMHTNNRSGIGKSGIIVSPFLDLNNNGIRDPDEQKAEGLKMSINGGKLENNVQDTVAQIFDLEPYTTYFLKIYPQSFDNINWSVKNHTLNVITDPNSMKLIEVPVVVSSEVSGMVYMKQGNSKKAQGKIVVFIYDADSVLVAKTMTESDGYFSVYTLQPGTYRACVDPNQLEKLGLISLPEAANFNITKMAEGDVVDGIELVLEPKQK